MPPWLRNLDILPNNRPAPANRRKGGVAGTWAFAWSGGNMHPENNSGWVRKVLGMALLGLVVVVFAGPIAAILGLALVGYLAFGAFRLLAGGTGTFRTVIEGAGNFSRKLLNGIGWLGERVGHAVASVAGLGTRLV